MNLGLSLYASITLLVFKTYTNTRIRMLIGGADVSGSNTDGPENHVALVVGKEDEINRIYNKIGVRSIHMNKMSPSQRDMVRRNLDLSSADVRVWCFHVDRRNIEKSIRERMKSGKRQKPRINIRKSFESYWFRLFEGELKDFAVNFRAELSDIVMETDADICPTVKGWNFRNKHKGRAYELSDAVAWFNQKGVPVRNCRVVDLRDRMRKIMKKHLLK